MSGFLAPFPSLVDDAVINGDMNIWQRGTTFAAIANGAFSADRFRYGSVGAQVVTASRSTSVPANAGRLLNYALRHEFTTANASPGASDTAFVLQPVEGYNFLPFAQRPFWVSFYAYSNLAGTYPFQCSNSGNDRSFVSSYSLPANTWTKVTVPVSASPSAGTWDYTNGQGLKLIWPFLAGSTYNTPALNSWQSGNYQSFAGATNLGATVGNYIIITGVRMSLVPWPYQFAQTRSIGEEITLCQRYFEKGGFGLDIAPAAGVSSILYPSMTWAANNASCQIPFLQRKRAAPTITIYGGASGGSGNLAGVLVGGVFQTVASNAAERIETTSFGLASTYVGLAYGDSYGFNFGWTASAEL